jgi:PAS domain S-box-containing protein
MWEASNKPPKNVSVLWIMQPDWVATELESGTLASAFAAVDSAIAIADGSGRIQWANRAFTALTGFGPEEIAGRSALTLVSGNPDPEFNDNVQEPLLKGQTWRGEVMAARKDGSVYVAGVSITPVDGMFVASIADISALKLEQENLYRKQERLLLLYEKSPVPYQSLDRDGCLIEVNRAWLETLGYERQEVIGKWFGDFLVPHEIEVFRERFPQFRSVGRLRCAEFEMVRKDGSHIEVVFDGEVGMDREGNFRQTYCVFRDNTERKRAEQALLNSASEYRTLVENLGDVVMRLDRNGRYLFVNHSGALAAGIPEREIVGKTHSELGFPNPEYLDSQVRQAFTTGRLVEVEFRMELNGIQRDFDWRLFPERDAAGEIQTVLGIARDVTELRQTQLQYGTILRTATDAFCVAERSGQLVEANAALCNLLGYSRAELLKLRIQDIDAVETAEDTELHMQALASMGADRFETKFRRCDGSVIDVEVAANYVDDGAGKVFVFSHDISSRKGMEEAVRKSEEKYRRIVETAKEGVWSVDADHRTTFANQAIAGMLGWAAEELSGRSILDFMEADSAQRLREHLEHRSGSSDYRLRRKDGSEMWAIISGSPHIDGNGEYAGALLMITDITERRRMEERFIESQRLESVGRLAGGIAHDFNNLLTVINGYSILMMQQMHPNDTLYSNAVEIKNAGERAAALTQQLLAVSRKQVIQPKVLDLNALIGDLQRMLQRLIGEQIQFETSLAPSLGRILADPGQLNQTIMNLAVNARDAMPNGGRLLIETANVEIDQSCREWRQEMKPGLYVRLAVSDTGVGMSPQVRAHIFEPFFTTKEKGSGTGLGLAIVYGVVKQSHGFVSVYSEPGEGTTFKLYFPRTDEPAQSLNAPDAIAIERGRENVLVVEDQRDVRGLVCDVLKSYGYTVLEATNGEEALLRSEAFTGPIQLLLTDMVMPGMTGRQLAERLLSARPEIAVLYMSGYTDQLIAKQGVLESDVNFLEKPFSPAVLAQKVREVLGAARKKQSE